MAIEGLISKMDAESARQVAGCRFNSPGALLNFLRFLIVRLRVLGYAGVFFTVEGALHRECFLRLPLIETALDQGTTITAKKWIAAEHSLF